MTLTSCNRILLLYFQTQVSTNGILSFGQAFTFHYPEHFPGSSSSSYLVAPFWADNDITNGQGQVSYEVHDIPTEGMEWVGTFVSQQEQTSFSPSWMMVAEWKEVPQFGGLLEDVSQHI